MNILQFHSRYSNSLISGENSTVRDLNQLFSDFAKTTLIDPSTDTLNNSHRNQMIAAYKYLSLDKSLVKVAQDFDIVILHNPIPFISGSTIREISSNTKIVRVWHNYRNSCIAGNHFRNSNPCFRCTESAFGRMSGVLRSCYRSSFLQSAIVSKGESELSQIYSEDLFWHVGISSFMCSYIQNLGIDDSKIRMIPNSIDSAINLTTTSGSDFLMMGRLEPEKGFIEAIEAWNQLPQSIKGARRFHIVGNGSLYPTIKNLIDPRDAVLHGVLNFEEIANLATNCSVGVATSVWEEPFGKVAAEYLSFGLRCVVTPRGGLLEIAGNAPGGIITADTSRESIAAGMQAAIESPQVEKWIIREHFIENYSRSVIATKWKDFFSEVLGE